MKVTCIKNRGDSLSEKALKVSGTTKTEFSLSIGDTYIVYGILLWDGILKYLIIGNENLPSWYPAEFFELVDNCLPVEWYFDFFSGESLEAVWGYKEMVYDEDHYDNLIERDDTAIRIFLKRKSEIEEMYHSDF